MAMCNTSIQPTAVFCRRTAFIVFLFFVWFKPHAQVNIQTGSATFSIPVFNWQDNKSRLSAGVGLNYNSGNGLRVNETASNAGQGWNLLAGGVISRMQVGEPDDQMPYGLMTETDINKYPPGYLYASEPATKGCPDALRTYPLYKIMNQEYAQHNTIAGDKQLDYFSFQFNGKAGMFVLDPSNGDKGVTLGYSKLKISFQRDPSLATNTSLGIRTSITSFTIQDVDGLIYKFTKHGLAKVMKTEYCDINLNYKQNQTKFKDGHTYYQTAFDNVTINPWIINSWYLTEIEDALTHRKIKFNYTTRYISTRAGEDITFNDGDKNYCVINFKKSITQTPDILSINYPDSNNVFFNYASAQRADLPGAYALSSIDVQYKGRSKSKFIFNTSYFLKNRYGTPADDNQKKLARLCLRSVQKIGVDLKEDTPPYLFDYYLGSSDPDDFVPPQFSYTKDVWGFYNGSNSVGCNNAEPIPFTASVAQLTYSQLKGLCYLRKIGGVLSSNYFTAKPGYAKNGLLRQIIYPTGGTLTYQYAQNSAVFNNTTQFASGVHVSQTSATDGGFSNGCNNAITTSYNYVLTNGASSLWGLEMPVGSMIMQNHYQPEIKIYHWTPSSFPFGECYWRYKYPGILSRQQAIDLPGWINIVNTISPVLGILNVISTIKDVITVFSGGSPVALVVDLVLSFVQLMITCIGNEEKNMTVSVYYNFDLNSGNPLPAQFKRVEIVENPGTIGKTVQQFTSEDDYAVWAPTNPSFSSKQRFATWAYGLPKQTTIINVLGDTVKTVKNSYSFDDLSFSGINGHQLTNFKTQQALNLKSCKCLVKKNTSQRVTNWTDVNIYNSPGSYLTQSTPEMTVDIYDLYTGMVVLNNTSEKTYKVNDHTRYVETQLYYYYNPDNYQMRYLQTRYPLNEINSKSQTKEFRYVTDYVLPGTNNVELNKLYQNNLVNEQVRSAVYDDWYILNEKVTVYGNLVNGDVRPSKVLEQRFTNPTSSPSYYSPDIGASNPSYKTIQQLTYDNFGNLISSKDEGNRIASSIYGYDDKYVVASVLNAKPNEIFFDAFEEGKGWSGTTGTPYGDQPISAFDNTLSHTGKYSGRIDKPTAGERYCHSNQTLNISLTAPTKYKVTGWVYSNGPSVDIYLFMKRANESGYFSYVDYVTTNTVGQWVYLEKEFTVPADVTKLNIRLDNNGGGSVWFDDIRLYPANARMVSYTYDPIIGKTSESDANSRVTYYDYDNLGRLQFIKDEKKNIVKMYEYNNISAAKQNGCPGMYYNKLISETFTKNNCGAGFIGSDVVFNVPANAYSSALSQADADAQAEEYLMANGQAYANANGTCIQVYYNTAQSQNFTTQCEEGFIGSSVTYTVPAGRYSSIISQADANQQALDDIDANGQAWANSQPTCNVDTNPHWVWLDGAQTYCGNVNGQLPPHLFVLTTDINPNSYSYGQTSWQDSGPSSSCPSGNYYSVDYSGYYYSQNCPSGQTPIAYYVSVPPGMFSSTTSMSAANALAAQYAQNQANQYGSCQSSYVTMTYTNWVGYTWIVTLSDVNTNQVLYQFYIWYGGSGILGSVPAGTYNIRVSEMYPDYFWYTFQAGCGYYASGNEGNFSWVSIYDGCSNITIDY